MFRVVPGERQKRRRSSHHIAGNLRRPERKRAWPRHAFGIHGNGLLANQMVVELRAVILLDHNDATYAGERSRERFHRQRRQHPEGDDADLMAGRSKPPRGFARGRNCRAEGKNSNVALAPAFAPILPRIEALNLLGPLVDLSHVSARAAGRQAGLIVREAFRYPFETWPCPAAASA